MSPSSCAVASLSKSQAATTSASRTSRSLFVGAQISVSCTAWRSLSPRPPITVPIQSAAADSSGVARRTSSPATTSPPKRASHSLVSASIDHSNSISDPRAASRISAATSVGLIARADTAPVGLAALSPHRLGRSPRSRRARTRSPVRLGPLGRHQRPEPSLALEPRTPCESSRRPLPGGSAIVTTDLPASPGMAYVVEEGLRLADHRDMDDARSQCADNS